MLNMLNDPEIDKLIIYALTGIVAVLMLAVIFLAVKKNVYYVDDSGVEVPPPPKKSLFDVFKKKNKEEAEAPAEMPAEPEVLSVSATAADVPVSEDSFADEFSLPVFPDEPEAAAEEIPEDMPEAPEELPEKMMSDVEVDAAVDEFLADVPDGDETTVIDVSETVMPADPEELSEPQEESVAEEAAEAPEEVPTGVEVAVVIGNNVREYSINQLPCLLGREATACDLVISEPAVSRRHARILVADGQLCIEDVSEHNGTFLNATKLPSLGRAALHAGDRVTLGRATIDITKVLYSEEQ